MRILVIQFTPEVRDLPVPRFEPQLGTLLSLLRSRGHELALLGLARFDQLATKAALARTLPQLVYADISAVCGDVARRVLQYIQEHEFLPCIAGGALATIEPSLAVSLPGVQAAAIGEHDASLVTYFERMKDPAIGQVVSGVWLRDESGLARPALPALVEDLDSLPFPERDLFGYAELVQKSGMIEIAVGRGCPQACAYCRIPTLGAMYAQHGTFVRRRSSENVLEEIQALRARYPGVQLVRFLDHQFALDPTWLAEFLPSYAARCGIPFRCHLRANAATPEIVSALAAAGCRQVDVELISGSDFIRNEIFRMDLSGPQIESTFALLAAADIRSSITVYLGAPYESEASLGDTLALLRRLRPDRVDARPYYPWPGTDARELCRENGWLHVRGEEQYRGDASGIDMPACRPDTVGAFLRRMRQELPTRLDEPWWRRWSLASRSALGQLFPKRS